MRSRASQARALFRIVSAQTSTASSSSASSTATATAAARSTRSAAASKKRRNAEVAGKPKNEHKTIFIDAGPRVRSPSLAKQSVISGLEPVRPPLSSLSSVATQAFFALDRPLLEHQVVNSSTSSSDSSSQSAPSESSAKSTIENAREAIMEVASQASRLSPEQLSRTTFVISGAASNGKDGSGDQQGMAWPRKVASLDFARFSKLVDSISKPGVGPEAIHIQAMALEQEESHRKDVENAVANALERGEDTSVVANLGSEAELVVLGEPSGPNPKWPRGVATFLAERTRALEPPAAPLMEGEAELVQAMEKLEMEELARHFTGSENAFTMQNMSEDDPNLLLSHAMVQATLPARLQWDSVVAKMDAATGDKVATSPVDLSSLNANVLQAEEKASDEGDEVHMDSVRRKRRKKMRKHKYRKFRKATRVERTRLKK